MNRHTIWLAAALALAGCGEGGDKAANTEDQPSPTELAHANDTPEQMFAGIMHGMEVSYFSEWPQMASYYGVSEDVAGVGYAGALNVTGPREEAARRAAFEELLGRMRAVPTDKLEPQQKLYVETLTSQLDKAIAPGRIVPYGSIMGTYGSWFTVYPVTQLGGPQLDVTNLLDQQHAIKTVEDADMWLQRLERYGAAVDGAIESLAASREQGVIAPDFILTKALASLADKSVEPAADHPLIATFKSKLEAAGIEPGDRVEKAIGLIDSVYLPANARLKAVLEQQQPEAVHDAGIWRLPQGVELYQSLIHQMTDTNLTASQVHDIGLAEVARITAEMDEILKSQGLGEGPVGVRMQALLKDPKFLYPNTEEGKAEILAKLNGWMDEIMPLMPEWFDTIPTQKVVVRAVPKQNEGSATGGFYDAPSLDGSRPGTFWINLKNTATWPSYTLRTLVYHEAVPGHHFQTALGLGKDVPLLMSALYSNAFGEGWGLYSELLAKEMGLYKDDPFGDLGRLQAELHRAVRLVVDTGIHAKKWTREQAIDYMASTEGSHVDEATAEVERYVVWPGQALGYKLGMLKIVELRERARAAMGDRFRIGAFHDVILEDSGLPLDILEKKVDRWIAGELAG